MAREHEIAGVDADLVGHLHRVAAGRRRHRRLAHAQEQAGVPVGAETVVAGLRGAVEHGNAGRPGRARRVPRSCRSGRPLPPPSASAGSADGSPTTPFCTSCSTSAVCPGATSSARSSASRLLLDELWRRRSSARASRPCPSALRGSGSVADLPVRRHLVVRELLRDTTHAAPRRRSSRPRRGDDDRPSPPGRAPRGRRR